MLGCSEADFVGVGDAGKIVRVRRGDGDIEAAVSRFFCALWCEKMRGLGIFKMQKHSK